MRGFGDLRNQIKAGIINYIRGNQLLFQGYFQLLFSRIEQLLSLLEVQNLVLPAAEGAESIWIDKFGFDKIDPDQVFIHPLPT